MTKDREGSRAAPGETARGATVRGVVVPVATLLTGDDSLDEPAFARLLRGVLPHANAILALGTTGEALLLPEATRRQVIASTVETVSGRVPVVVAIAECATREVVRRTEAAARDGADLVLVSGPYVYAPATDDALERHFLTVADHSPVPLVVYEIPQNVGYSVPAWVLERLAEHPNVTGLKDSSGDFITFQKLLGLRSQTFTILQGREELAWPSLALGADGVASALGNLVPELFAQMIGELADGAIAASRASHARILSVAQVLAVGQWLPALKAVLAEGGIGNGKAVPPLEPLTEEQLARLRRIASGIGLYQAGLFAAAES